MPPSNRGADAVITALRRAGVQHLFTLSGNQIMPLLDACLGSDMRLIHVRHEAAAVHMADAWGRLTGRPGVALVTAGPGMANCLTALYVARMAEAPVVLLSGHAPLAQRGRGAFQEIDQAAMAAHVAKRSWTASGAEPLDVEVARALEAASSGRPGPVYLGLPFDLLEAHLADGHVAESLRDSEAATARSKHPATSVSERRIYEPEPPPLEAGLAARIVAELARAARPLILVGPSLMRGAARESLETLRNLTGIPVIGMESPRGVNDPSLGAFAEVLDQADRILLLGKQLDFTLQLDDRPAYNPGCRFWQVDPQPHVLELSARVLGDASRLPVAALGDAGSVIEPLVQAAGQHHWKSGSWLADVQASIDYRPAAWSTTSGPPEGPLHPLEVCRGAQAYLDGGAGSVFISDGGEFGQWAQACVRAPRRLINGTSGSIGVAVPFALAARLAFPEARIATVLGDGTFGFHALEFDTAVRCRLPFVAVLGNDAMWNAEYQIQLRKYGAARAVGCELLATRYDQVVAAVGGHGEQVTAAAELPAALDRASASGLPACVNISLQNAPAPVIRRRESGV